MGINIGPPPTPATQPPALLEVPCRYCGTPHSERNCPKCGAPAAPRQVRDPAKALEDMNEFRTQLKDPKSVRMWKNGWFGEELTYLFAFDTGEEEAHLTFRQIIERMGKDHSTSVGPTVAKMLAEQLNMPVSDMLRWLAMGAIEIPVLR